MKRSNAASLGVPIKNRTEECVVTHGAKVKRCSFAGCTNGAMRDVPTMPRREEFVLDINCVAMRDVPTMPRGWEEFVLHIKCAAMRDVHIKP